MPDTAPVVVSVNVITLPDIVTTSSVPSASIVNIAYLTVFALLIVTVSF